MRVLSHPFGRLADQWGQIERQLPQAVGQSLAVSLESEADVVRDAVRNHPGWDSQVADSVEVFPAGGSLVVGVRGASTETAANTELGMPDTAALPLLSSVLRGRRSAIERSFSSELMRSLGLKK